MGKTSKVADIVPKNQQETSNDSADLEGNLGPAEPADSDAEKKDEAMEDILYLYKARLIEDLGFKDFNALLLNLEVSGKIRTSSMSRGKRRIELVQ